MDTNDQDLLDDLFDSLEYVDSWQPRFEALQELVEIAHPYAVEACLNALSDENSSIRINAVIYLNQYEDIRILEALIKVVKEDIDYSTRLEAVNILTKFGQAAMDAFVHSLNDEDSLAIIKKASQALIKIGTPAVPSLLEIVQNKVEWDSYCRTYATLCLADISDSRTRQPLVDILQDASEESFLRGAAAYGLGNHGDEAVRTLLLDYLINNVEETGEIKAGVIKGLARIGEERAREIIIQATSDSNEEIRTEATRALSRFSDSRRDDLLIAALTDLSPKVREAAVEVIGKASITSALPAFLDIFKTETE